MDAIAGKLSEWKANGGLGATRRSASTSQRQKWQRGKNGVVVRRLKGSCVDDGRLAGRARLGSRRRGHPPFSAIRKCGKNDPPSPLTARYCYSALHHLTISSSVHILLHTLPLPGCRPLPHNASPCQMRLGKHQFPRSCCSPTCETRNMPYLDSSLKRVPLHHWLLCNDWPRPLSTRRVIACILRHIFTAQSRPGLPSYALLGRFSKLTRGNGLWARGAGWWLKSHCFLHPVHHDVVMPSYLHLQVPQYHGHFGFIALFVNINPKWVGAMSL